MTGAAGGRGGPAPALAALVLALASACASARIPDAEAVPGSGPVPRAAAPPARTIPASPETTPVLPARITLEEAVRIALAGNPDLAAAERAADAARAGRAVVEAGLLPRLAAVTGYGRSLDPRRLAAARENGEPGAFSRDLFSADLVLRFPLYTGGRLTSEIRGAARAEEAVRQGAARAAQVLRFRVSDAYFEILARTRHLESLRFSRGTLEEHRSRIVDLISAGKAARVDLLRTEVRLADLEEQLTREENLLGIRFRQLGNLLGLPAGASVPELVDTLSRDPEPVPGPDAALDAAMARRPDLLAARAERDARMEAVRAARAASLPEVALEGRYGWRWAGEPTERPPGTDLASDEGQLGVVVNLPLFEGGGIAARVRQERARLAAAGESLRALELEVRLDVAVAAANLSSAAVRVETTGKAIEQARESLRIERELYELGKGAIVDVLDAQSALLEAETAYHRALADQAVARAELDLATGAR